MQSQTDPFSQYHQGFLDSTYDCVDRIVLNGYFYLAQSAGGFRHWWRQVMGSDEHLDNTHLMRFAGRFSRRIHAYCKNRNIPLIYCKRGERKHELAEELIPTDAAFCGVFCILVNRAPAPVFDIRQFSSGAIDIRRKDPMPYVNHYSFHIIDRQWGHLTIKLCPHPPFNAQIILNGHEYVALQAHQQHLEISKDGNCFTHISNAPDLSRIADTMRAKSSVGRLSQVCERWIYSACLCFALEVDEQKRSGFHYSYSVYQVEYSRNLLFHRGYVMEQIFQSVIDRTRSLLDLKIVKSIFGFQRRPHSKADRKKRAKFEALVEKPVYDLTVFRINFGKLVVKIYSKGERVLRIEALAHNTQELKCGKELKNFPEMVVALKQILERFLTVLRSIDASFIDSQTLDNWRLSSKVGNCRVGGIDVNQVRIRAVMNAIIALSVDAKGFTASALAEKVKEILADKSIRYQARQASYDLKKFRGKHLVFKLGKTRRYEAHPEALRNMAACLILREKVIRPLLENAAKAPLAPKAGQQCLMDQCYRNIHIEMQNIFKQLNLAA